MKDIETANEEYLQAQQEDFYGFLKENRWSDAQCVVDNLYDLGLTAEAVTLRKALLNAQVEYADACDCPKGGEYSDGTVCGKCNGTEWVTHFTPKDNPLNNVKVQMDTILSELNPNRGDAPY